MENNKMENNKMENNDMEDNMNILDFIESLMDNGTSEEEAYRIANIEYNLDME